MAGKNSGNDIRCSFCNKTQSQVRKLIAGPAGVYICDECVDICADILEEELEDRRRSQRIWPDRYDYHFPRGLFEIRNR